MKLAKTKTNKFIYLVFGLLSMTLILFAPTTPVFAANQTDGSGGGSNKGQPKDNETTGLSTQPDASECNGGAGCCNGVKVSFNFGCKKGSGQIQSNPIFGLLLALVNFLGIGVGIAVVIGVIVGGFKYMTSNGNAGQVEDAKKTITNSIIALFVFAFMYALINFLVPGGVFK